MKALPVTTRVLKADPIDPGLPFVGGTGWVGGLCACGFRASARTLTGLYGCLDDHQESEACAWGAERRVIEKELHDA